MLSIAAPKSTLTVVKLAASIKPGASAKRHRIELAAKQSIAAAISTIDRGDILSRAHPYDTASINGWRSHLLRMTSARRAASSPTPDRNEEFILESQGKPRK
jgi:hypothetical protein